ncbi:putative Holliday junction resolvase [Tepidanaerobacter acetatoxydans Re1]|uniref:Putative pre-16S rRNA nuclease n=1 Tax=Tepidanaerobacter acetatoxydans (strain DSM 21804 / JCM 16047 / Re1) TaxID=1209989 RepID=F4LVI9_TEPAE|nr:Holliday junction resolvase RuvX [Tepidanaerobacter acetatoxydans]AEE91575.1 Holliday junction resolvase [Tepidanaerobacter acetatoxydans Re1]CCP26298.1 putative Holliday junction resolvase [Tepidanaerobacter acetatoxydans Re1]
MRILGLDVGEKRVGVAISDELGLTAQGIDVIERKNDGKNKDIDRICRIISDYNVTKVIVGLPKNMNGTLGPSSEAVENYTKKLQKAISIDLEFWDERLTTAAAERILIEADVSRQKRKGVIDKLAAVLILQSYLDSKYGVDTR